MWIGQTFFFNNNEREAFLLFEFQNRNRNKIIHQMEELQQCVSDTWTQTIIGTFGSCRETPDSTPLTVLTRRPSPKRPANAHSPAFSASSSPVSRHGAPWCPTGAPAQQCTEEAICNHLNGNQGASAGNPQSLEPEIRSVSASSKDPAYFTFEEGFRPRTPPPKKAMYGSPLEARTSRMSDLKTLHQVQ